MAEIQLTHAYWAAWYPRIFRMSSLNLGLQASNAFLNFLKWSRHSSVVKPLHSTAQFLTSSPGLQKGEKEKLHPPRAPQAQAGLSLSLLAHPAGMGTAGWGICVQCVEELKPLKLAFGKSQRPIHSTHLFTGMFFGSHIPAHSCISEAWID